MRTKIKTKTNNKIYSSEVISCDDEMDFSGIQVGVICSHSEIDEKSVVKVTIASHTKQDYIHIIE